MTESGVLSALLKPVLSEVSRFLIKYFHYIVRFDIPSSQSPVVGIWEMVYLYGNFFGEKPDIRKNCEKWTDHTFIKQILKERSSKFSSVVDSDIKSDEAELRREKQIVVIRQIADQFSAQTLVPCNHSFSAWGKVGSDGEYIIGSWQEKDRKEQGVLHFKVRRRGDYMYGYWIGDEDNDQEKIHPVYAHWERKSQNVSVRNLEKYRNFYEKKIPDYLPHRKQPSPGDTYYPNARPRAYQYGLINDTIYRLSSRARNGK